MNGVNQKVSINQLLLKNLYFRYRAFVTPLVTIVVCILLFFFVVTQQIQNWFAMRDALAVDTQSVAVMHQNLSLVTSLDDAKLNQTLATATSALPTEKDFTGIVTALQNAAAIAGTSLGDYSFQLGNLSGDTKKSSQLPIQLTIALRGNITDAQRFAQQLHQELPLSDTIAIAVNANASISVTVVFYYAPLLKITFQDDTPLPVVGSADQQLLEKLANESTINTVILASPSATPSPTPRVSPTAVPTLAPTLSPTPTGTSSAQ